MAGDSQAQRQDDSQAQEPGEPAHLPDDFQDQLPLVGLLRGDAEGVFHHFGGFFHALFLGVIEAAEHRAGVHFLAHFDFENDADGGIDRRLPCCSRPAPIMLEATPMSSASMTLT